MVRRIISDNDGQRIVEAYINQKTTKDIALVLGLPPITVRGIIRVYIDENRITRKKGGSPPVVKLSDDQKATIRFWVQDNCTLALAAIKSRIENEWGNTSLSYDG